MPGLKIYYGDSIEKLAGKLVEALKAERKAKNNPFDFSQVVVPNANIAKWLRMRAFSDEPSLCMGIEFPFVEQCLFTMLRDSLEPKYRPQLLPMNAYANGIMSILLKDGDPRLAPFRRYIADGDGGPLAIDSRNKARMAWQLAIKLADLMDKYEVHRQNVMEKWLDGRRAAEIADPTEKAEAALAQKLFWETGVCPSSGTAVSLRQLFERVKKMESKPDAAEKKRPTKNIHFFGMSMLSSLQVDIVRWLARTHDIEIYHNNVCLEYWGDIETKRERSERLRRLKGADEDIALENVLLQNWGRAGRETLRLFVDLEESNGNSPSPIRFEWNELPSSAEDGDSMLKKVQKSVRRRISEVGRVERQDASIQIVGAPGIRREVEMVYNAILGAVWKPDGSGTRPWSDCTFSDIAVLVPDMAAYRPVIEAVFDARGQIPYGLVDTSASGYSRYLEGFMALMAVAREGLSRETVFAVLGNSCVQRALGFTPQDARDWMRYAEEIGAFDGFEDEGECGNVSWNRALSRLRLGIVAKDKPGLTVWEGGGDSALKFSEIVETLYRELSPLAVKRLFCTASASEAAQRGNWADTLRHVAGEFLENDRDDMLEETVRRNLFNMLYALDKIGGMQNLDFVVAAVEEFAGGIKCQKGGYLTHGVTISGLQPMRPVPFKQVFVLGMGEGMFPGRDGNTTLEIRGAVRTLGDVGATAMNRYLFLETLMATRERLVISYPNLDVAKDAELFPSGMVCELEEFLEKNVLPEPQGTDVENARSKFLEVKLPLLERGEKDDFAHGRKEDDILEDPAGPIRWGDGYYAGLIPTYSNVERSIAQRVAHGEDAEVSAIGSTDVSRSAARGNAERIAITAKELAEFLESPLRATLRRQHGIAVEGYRDGSIDADVPLEIASGPTSWEFQRAVLNAVPDDPAATDIKGVYKDFSDRGCLPEPDGMFGCYALKKATAELAGDAARRESLGALKRFADGFRLDKGVRPDPVRVLVPARTGTDGTLERCEILYTGQTSGWIQSGDGLASRALVFNRCGDARKSKGEVGLANFPPKAVLEPLVTWLIMVAGKEDARRYSLRVGIADMDQMLYNGWTWDRTPMDARAYIDGLADEYLKYLANPDADGCYLDYGYSDMAKALENAIKMKMIGGTTPKDDDEWKKVLDAFSADDCRRGGDGFNSNLVIERVVGPLSRMPENNEDGADLDVVKARFARLFKQPLGGTRKNGQDWEV